jgi:hypothetical protein
MPMHQDHCCAIDEYVLLLQESRRVHRYLSSSTIEDGLFDPYRRSNGRPKNCVASSPEQTWQRTRHCFGKLDRGMLAMDL